MAQGGIVIYLNCYTHSISLSVKDFSVLYFGLEIKSQKLMRDNWKWSLQLFKRED